MRVDIDAVLAAFDDQIRRHPSGPVERDGHIVRTVSPGGGWNGVTWSDLRSADVDAVVAAQVARYAEAGCAFEWKLYSYDQPPDLPQRLAAAGLVAEPQESLMFAEVDDLAPGAALPDGVMLVPVTDVQGVDRLVRLHDEVFGGDHTALGREVFAGLGGRVEAVLAVADGRVIAGGRVELNPGSDFAGLWGGGTVPDWRGRGVFRALVAHRAAIARERGYRWLQVDALPTSRPILERLGFVQLATTTPFVSAS